MSYTLVDLKRQTKVQLISAGTSLLRLFPKNYFPSSGVKLERKGRHYCIFYLSNVGSLGDDAMGYSVIKQIRDQDPQARISMLIHAEQDRAYFEHYGVELVSIEGYFDVMPSSVATRRIDEVLQTTTDFIICGADVLDGVYSPGSSYRRLYAGVIAKGMGVKVYVVGFSFSDRAPALIRDMFRTQCQEFDIVCRDPLSAERLSAVMGRKIPNAADLAFLLPIGETCGHPAAQEAERVVAQWRSENRPVIVFNANPLSFSNAFPEASRADTVKVLAKGVEEFVARTGAAVLFLTHDNRPSFSDARFSSEIIDALSTKITYHFVPETVHATDIKRLCTLVDLVVTGRMHLGIAALGAGRTTMITDYQGKVRGLYKLFGITGLALDLREVVEPGRLSALMLKAFEAREGYEAQVSAGLPEVKNLSKKNLEALWQ